MGAALGTIGKSFPNDALVETKFNSCTRKMWFKASRTASTDFGPVYANRASTTRGAILDLFSISSTHLGRAKTSVVHKRGQLMATVRQWRETWVTLTQPMLSGGNSQVAAQQTNILESISGGRHDMAAKLLRRDLSARMAPSIFSIS